MVGSRRRGSIVEAVVPGIDIRGLDAERGQGGADLAAVIRPVGEHLGEADADWRPLLKPSSSSTSVTTAAESGFPASSTDQARPVRSIAALSSYRLAWSSSINRLRSPFRTNKYQASEPSRCRAIARIEPYVPGTAVALVLAQRQTGLEQSPRCPGVMAEGVVDQ